jgi:hypothetical protein
MTRLQWAGDVSRRRSVGAHAMHGHELIISERAARHGMHKQGHDATVGRGAGDATGSAGPLMHWAHAHAGRAPLSQALVTQCRIRSLCTHMS